MAFQPDDWTILQVWTFCVHTENWIVAFWFYAERQKLAIVTVGYCCFTPSLPHLLPSVQTTNSNPNYDHGSMPSNFFPVSNNSHSSWHSLWPGYFWFVTFDKAAKRREELMLGVADAVCTQAHRQNFNFKIFSSTTGEVLIDVQILWLKLFMKINPRHIIMPTVNQQKWDY